MFSLHLDRDFTFVIVYWEGSHESHYACDCIEVVTPQRKDKACILRLEMHLFLPALGDKTMECDGSQGAPPTPCASGLTCDHKF